MKKINVQMVDLMGQYSKIKNEVDSNIISSIDKPSSPAADSLSDFNSNIRGFTQEMRKKFRT